MSKQRGGRSKRTTTIGVPPPPSISPYRILLNVKTNHLHTLELSDEIGRYGNIGWGGFSDELSAAQAPSDVSPPASEKLMRDGGGSEGNRASVAGRGRH